MPDGDVPALTIKHVAAATGESRRKILGLSEEGWFGATKLAELIGIGRDAAREHCVGLAAVGLLGQRETRVRGQRTFEWRILPLGRLAHSRLAAITGERVEPRAAPERVALVAVLDASDLGELKVEGDGDLELYQALRGRVASMPAQPTARFRISRID